jgi:hypothetical protein
VKFRLTKRAECELDRIQDYFESKIGSSERIIAELARLSFTSRSGRAHGIKG